MTERSHSSVPTSFKWLLKSNSFKRFGVYCINVINLGQASFYRQARVRSRTRRANRWIVHQFYSSSVIIIAVVVCGSLLRHLMYKQDKIEIQISTTRRSSDDDLRQDSRRWLFVRGIWFWQLVILDDSFDYLSARYARSVGDRFSLSLSFSVPSVLFLRFLAGLQTAATPSHLWIISQYDVLCVCHTDAFELKSYAWTPTRTCYGLTHITSSRLRASFANRVAMLLLCLQTFGYIRVVN